jgi:hypothetical protein
VLLAILYNLRLEILRQGPAARHVLYLIPDYSIHIEAFSYPTSVPKCRSYPCVVCRCDILIRRRWAWWRLYLAQRLGTSSSTSASLRRSGCLRGNVAFPMLYRSQQFHFGNLRFSSVCGPIFRNLGSASILIRDRCGYAFLPVRPYDDV